MAVENITSGNGIITYMHGGSSSTSGESSVGYTIELDYSVTTGIQHMSDEIISLKVQNADLVFNIIELHRILGEMKEEIKTLKQMYMIW